MFFGFAFSANVFYGNKSHINLDGGKRAII